MELKRRLSEPLGPHFGGERGGRMTMRTSTCTASQSLMNFGGLEGGIFYGQRVRVEWW